VHHTVTTRRLSTMHGCIWFFLCFACLRKRRIVIGDILLTTVLVHHCQRATVQYTSWPRLC
jgi:hypothetical protein